MERGIRIGKDEKSVRDEMIEKDEKMVTDEKQEGV